MGFRMMSATSDGWRAGVRDSLPILVAAAPVGLVFGAVAVQNGATVADAVLMSATVYAGASQMVAVDLFGQSVPAWAIVLSVFAVNFRHVLYSAAVTKVMRAYRPLHRAFAFAMLIDPQYALVERRQERGLDVPLQWYLGLALPIYVLWIVEGWLGATFGALISEPRAFGLDMILPVYFMALVMGFRSRSRWLPVVLTSGIVSIVVYMTPGLGPPWHVTLGALAGIAMAAALPPNVSHAAVAETVPAKP